MCCNIWFQCFLSTCQLRADASADSGQPPHSGLLLLILFNNQKYMAYFLVTPPTNNPEGPPPHLGSLGHVSCCEPGSTAVSKTTHPPNAKVGFKCKLLFILGKGPATKFDEFLEKFQREGGSFSIQKFWEL